MQGAGNAKCECISPCKRNAPTISKKTTRTPAALEIFLLFAARRQMTTPANSGDYVTGTLAGRKQVTGWLGSRAGRSIADHHAAPKYL